LAARRYAEAVLRGREPPPFDPLWLAPKARRFVRGCFALTRDVGAKQIRASWER
jgi:hypothetical protein